MIIGYIYMLCYDFPIFLQKNTKSPSLENLGVKLTIYLFRDLRLKTP